MHFFYAMGTRFEKVLRNFALIPSKPRFDFKLEGCMVVNILSRAATGSKWWHTTVTTMPEVVDQFRYDVTAIEK